MRVRNKKMMVSTDTLNKRLQIILERLEDMNEKLDGLHFNSTPNTSVDKRIKTWLDQ